VSRPFEVAHLDELDSYPVGSEGLMWRPVRRRFGVEAFGVNAYTVAEAGQEVVEHHDEVPQGGGAAGHQELYVVLRGRATFTLDGEEVDAPAGTLVFIRDPAVRRGAVAREPDTAVLAVGGAPGEPYRISPWEYTFEAFGYHRTGEYERGLEHLRGGLDRYPDNWSLLFNLACYESLLGRREDALEHLRRAVELSPRALELAQTDKDFDPIRDDPRFPRPD
jgi:quercetin dioxygenase-like cupin family protein